MTKYHAHEAIIATGPNGDRLPTVGDFIDEIGGEVVAQSLWNLIVGPAIAPGDSDGKTYATYAFLPDGEDSWDSPQLGGKEAREAFITWLRRRLPDFEIVHVEFGTKAWSGEGRYDAVAEDLP